tara:strand:- start:418 stop:633 length:216 start_codon:yes stop_codon:yes gene_type:complete
MYLIENINIFKMNKKKKEDSSDENPGQEITEDQLKALMQQKENREESKDADPSESSSISDDSTDAFVVFFK